MDVEKSYSVAFAKGVAQDIHEASANLPKTTGGNMTWYQRVRHTFEAALLQVDIGPTHFGEFDLEDGRVWLEIRAGHLTKLDRRVRLGNDCGQGHLGFQFGFLSLS